MQHKPAQSDLQSHMISTYFSLRRFMWIVAFLTPAAIVAWGFWWHVPWQASISAYYFAPEGNQWMYSPYPCRVIFVGVLFALGACLIVYQGFTRLEDWLMNGAGLFALLVAIFPMYPETGYISVSRTVHFTSALALFVCLGATALLCNESTLKWMTDPIAKARFKRAYQVIGILMILFPAIGYGLAILFGVESDYVFWIETAGIEIFATYWLLKNIELAMSGAESKIMRGMRPPTPPAA